MRSRTKSRTHKIERIMKFIRNIINKQKGRTSESVRVLFRTGCETN